MKAYKKLMDMLAFAEEVVLVLSTAVILVLTVGNVFSRKVIHQSWSFTEELVVAVFVLITLLAAALACRKGQLDRWSAPAPHGGPRNRNFRAVAGAEKYSRPCVSRRRRREARF